MKSFKNIIISGYPKSGNTWLSRLVATLVNCPVAGFIDEPGNNDLAKDGADRISQFRVFKSHYTWSQLLCSPTHPYRVIYVIRNPLDIVVSGAFYFNFAKFRSLRPGVAPLDIFEAMIETVCYGSSYPWCDLPWNEHILTYASNLADILIIRYEDLISEPKNQLIRVALHLGLKINESDLNKAIMLNDFNFVKNQALISGDLERANFMREGKIGAYHNHLSLGQIDLIRSICASQMKNLGYLD